MHQEFWHERWQQNQIGFHCEDINQHLQKNLACIKHKMQGPPFSVQMSEVKELYSRWCDLDLLCMEDKLEREPRFRDKGVSRMQEQVYKLTVL